MAIHISNIHGLARDSVGQLIQNQIAKIACQSLAFNELGFYHFNGVDQEPTKTKFPRFDGIIASVTNNDTLILQSPSYNGIKWDLSFINHISVYNLNKIILINEIPQFKHEQNQSSLNDYLRYYNYADVLIVPSIEAKTFLQNHGLQNKIFIIQTFLDYPFPFDFPEPVMNSHHANYLSQNKQLNFTKNWSKEVPLTIYGQKVQTKDNIRYSLLAPDPLILYKLRQNGGFGIVWPQKQQSPTSFLIDNLTLSTFLAAGLPVIVNQQDSHQKIIVHKKLGFAVPSLVEAANKIKQVSDTDYQQMVQNVDLFARLIRNGYFTKRALIEAIFKTKFA